MISNHMPYENTDENTAQPVYRLSVPVILESPVQAGSIPERSDKESFCLQYASFCTFFSVERAIKLCPTKPKK